MTRRELIQELLLDGSLEDEMNAIWLDDDFTEHLFKVCATGANTISIQEIERI